MHKNAIYFKNRGIVLSIEKPNRNQQVKALIETLALHPPSNANRGIQKLVQCTLKNVLLFDWFVCCI